MRKFYSAHTFVLCSLTALQDEFCFHKDTTAHVYKRDESEAAQVEASEEPQAGYELEHGDLGFGVALTRGKRNK